MSRCILYTAKHTFPQRLQVILDDPILSDIICWLPEGECFVILRPDQLCSRVLPHYFSPDTSLKYSSFKRKLNRWGFHQIRKGPDTGAFHHPLFKRDQPDLCLRMDCEKAGGILGNKSKTAADKNGSDENITSPIIAELSKEIIPSPCISRIINDSLVKFQSRKMPSL